MQKAWLLLLALAFLTAGAEAQPYEAVVAGDDSYCVVILPVLQNIHEWIDAAPAHALERPGAGALAAAGGRRLYGTTDFGDRIEEVRRGQAPRLIATMPGAQRAQELVVDAAGNIHVLTSIPSAIVSLDPTGTVLATYPLGDHNSAPHSYDNWALDLAADQCTLFLIDDHTTIRRFNVCTGAFLADFATLAGATDVKVLPDGGVLVSRGHELVRFNAAGAVVRTYSLGDGDELVLGLARGGMQVWIGERACAGHVRRMDLNSGLVLATYDTTIQLAESVVALDAWTAALGNAAAEADVPTASELALFTIAALLAGIAVRRLS